VAIKNKIVKLKDHIDLKYGKAGTQSREVFERGYEAFKKNVVVEIEFKKIPRLSFKIE